MVRSRSLRSVAAAVAVALLAATALSGCSPRPRVIVYGDSLVFDAGREIQQWSAARGYDVTIHQRFGGAPCSMFARMRQDRASRPAHVIISFSGNTKYLEPCVGDDVAASYRAQMREVKRIWTGSGTQVTWAATPRLPTAVSETAQEAMRVESYRQGLRVLDGGKYVSPGRVWAWTQPCMPGERCVGRQINSAVAPGRNIVRANDKVHFCPGGPKGFEPCSTYSSGSWRFARAITEALA